MHHTTTVFIIALILCTFVRSNNDYIPKKITNIDDFVKRFPTELQPFLKSCESDNSDLYSMHNVYYSCYGEDKNAPLWTVHSIKAEQLRGQGSRPTVSTWFTAFNDDSTSYGPGGDVFLPWNNYNMDRGHLVPNGDVKTEFEKKSTFHVMNRAPQIAYINRGVWRCVETSIRNAIQRVNTEDTKDKSNLDSTELYFVVTFLEYGNNQQATVTNDGIRVSVPNSYNKVVYRYKNQLDLQEVMCITQTNLQYDSDKSMTDESQSKPQYLKWRECKRNNLFSTLQIPDDQGEDRFFTYIKKLTHDDEEKFKCSAVALALKCNSPTRIFLSHPHNIRKKNAMVLTPLERLHYNSFRCPKPKRNNAENCVGAWIDPGTFQVIRVKNAVEKELQQTVLADFKEKIRRLSAGTWKNKSRKMNTQEGPYVELTNVEHGVEFDASVEVVCVSQEMVGDEREVKTFLENNRETPVISRKGRVRKVRKSNTVNELEQEADTVQPASNKRKRPDLDGLSENTPKKRKLSNSAESPNPNTPQTRNKLHTPQEKKKSALQVLVTLTTPNKKKEAFVIEATDDQQEILDAVQLLTPKKK